jgi:hypothetical protein
MGNAGAALAARLVVMGKANPSPTKIAKKPAPHRQKDAAQAPTAWAKATAATTTAPVIQD